MDRKTFFNEMAASWDERFYTEELKARLEKIVLMFNIKIGETVLDVGSGTGGIIPYILKAVGHNGFVYGVDYAEEMINIAKKKFINERRVEFKVCSVESLPFRNEYFDRIICFGAFPHFENKEVALSEMNRVLKKDCSLIISHAMSSEEIRNHHRKAEPVKNDFLPEEGEMIRILKNTNFLLIRLHDQPGLYLCEAIKV